MECRDAQFYLRLRRPGADELGPDVTAELDRHLVGCPHCGTEARTLSAVDAVIGHAMLAVPVPAGLRDRLVAHVSAQRGAELRRKAYRYAGVAAALFLSVGFGFGLFSASRPKLDTHAMVQDAGRDPKELAEAWLRQKKLPTELPRPFDYDLLVSCGQETVQGRDVPVLVFRHPTEPGFAKVYFFEKNRFDVKGAKDAQASYCQAVLIDDPERFRGGVFVILYTGDRLTPFLKPGHGPTAAAPLG